MSKPVIANPKPYYVELSKGRPYLWCSCGLSKRQPYCDGSHKGTGFEPIRYVAQNEGEEVLFCGCKQTATGPFCDGSHNAVPGGYSDDDPNSPTNAAIPYSTNVEDERRFVDGRCYVYDTKQAQLHRRGNTRFSTVIDADFGALYQSQFYLEIAEGESPAIDSKDKEVTVFVSEGKGSINIGGKTLAIKATDGIYVRPGEVYNFCNSGSKALKVFISACPSAAQIDWCEAVTGSFDHQYPQRVVAVDEAQRQAMASRYFQMLVDKAIGSNVVTQFIGHIPQSKAAPHRHLYEEALIILSGEGCLWTESCKTKVAAGDVIFLPAKQIHSLQSTLAEGMDVMGVIYPGDNPSINY